MTARTDTLVIAAVSAGLFIDFPYSRHAIIARAFDHRTRTAVNNNKKRIYNYRRYLREVFRFFFFLLFASLLITDRGQRGRAVRSRGRPKLKPERARV